MLLRNRRQSCSCWGAMTVCSRAWARAISPRARTWASMRVQLVSSLVSCWAVVTGSGGWKGQLPGGLGEPAGAVKQDGVVGAG